MATRVGVLRCRYRVRGAAPDPHEVHRLDRLAAGSVAAELERALGELGDGAAVVVVRRVRAATVVDPTGQAEPALARAWGHDLARSVVRAIDEGIGDSTRVVRFASEAEFVAAFVADLLAGAAWRRWYFGAFSHLRHRSVAGAVAAVFAEHRDVAPAVLAALAERGTLDTLLATVDATALGLAPPAAAPGSAAAVDGWRPLVAAAVHVVGVLGLWAGAVPAPDVLARSWAVGAPRQPDWRDPAALADAVAAVVGWLVGRGEARAPAPPVLLGTAAGVAALDWLDLPRLARALARIGAADAGLPTRGALPTPRRRAVLAALLRAVEERRPVLDPAAAAGAANAVRLLAALAAVEPDVAADPLARVVIDEIVAARATASAVPEPRTGDGPAAAIRWRTAEPSAAVPPASPGAVVPPDAATAAVLSALNPPGGDGAAEAVDSPCAGVLLLARVLLDLRLAALAQRRAYPPAGPAHLLAAVGVRWAGPAGAVGRALDPAVRLLAGEGAPCTSDELAAVFRGVAPDAHDRWAVVLDELCARHGLDPADTPGDVLDRTADTALRVWARWLRGFDRSSSPFLLDRFVRRPGGLVVGDEVVRVLLPRRPLDVVLEMSGYLLPLEPLPGTPGRRIEFVLGGSS